MSNKSGFTLVEAIVTVFIITVALWGTVTGLLKINSLVEDIENIAVVDKYIAGETEKIRSKDFGSILEVEEEDIPGAIVGGATITMSTEMLNEPEKSISIQVGGESYLLQNIVENIEENIKGMKISADWTPSRSIIFYVYKKGINWRP